MVDWTPLILLLGVTGPLLVLKGWITRHLQGVGFLLWGDTDAAMLLYFLALFPGILLHELSHWLFAKLLGVKTGKISLWPSRQRQGRVRLGSVQMARVDPLRSSLIGAAPLIVGILLIFLIGDQVLIVSPAFDAALRGDWATAWTTFRQYGGASDFWIWLYLIFAIANSMFPSESDRESWWTTFGLLGALLAVVYLSGAVQSVPEDLADILFSGARYLAYAFALTVLVNAAFALLIGLSEWGLSRIRGVQVNY